MSRDAMENIVKGRTTVADRIRALNEAGYARAEIATFLSKRYQHVRNVLEGDKLKLTGFNRESDRGARSSQKQARTAEHSPDAPTRIGNLFRLTVEAGGVVRLPQAVLDAFGLFEGRVVVGDLDNEVFVLMSQREGLRRARAMIPQWQPGESMWSEELIERRRAESEREAHD